MNSHASPRDIFQVHEPARMRARRRPIVGRFLGDWRAISAPIAYNTAIMGDDFTDAELLAYFDEGLPVERMAAVENVLRASADLQKRAAGLRQQRDVQGHSVGEIWRRGRLSCPTRHQLGSFLLEALPADLARYIRFHLETIGCRYCAANLDDLREAAGQRSTETARRRQKYFESSAGYVRNLRSDE